ncbi:MAG: CvpA family protein [Candidatus Omnitrophica bacterium]|nr:CvpA family protein [Candidatus Omnitrophota bacterium]
MIFGIYWLDIVYIVTACWMLYRGSKKGLGSQLVFFIWWFVLLFFAIGYYDTIASKYLTFISNKWAEPVAFAVIVAAFSGLIKGMEILANISLKDTLTPIETMGGVIMAALRTIILFGIIGFQLMLVPVDGVNDIIAKHSRSAMFFVKIDVTVYSWLTRNLIFLKRDKDDFLVKKIMRTEVSAISAK